jgi:gamma-glutamylcyclotransferase (GGCT)/AIG2-like uncharacterized protein YtfP
MASYFFYGTLREPEIAREILGRPLSGCSPRRGVLLGYKRVYVAGATYPAIHPDADSKVDGLVVSRISAIEAARLSRYEGPGYETQDLDVIVEGGGAETVRVFVPKNAIKLSNREWDLETWRRQEKKRFMAGLKRNILI